jgi:hypothetical protein
LVWGRRGREERGEWGEWGGLVRQSPLFLSVWVKGIVLAGSN